MYGVCWKLRADQSHSENEGRFALEGRRFIWSHGRYPGIEIKSDCFDFGERAVVHPTSVLSTTLALLISQSPLGQTHTTKKHWMRNCVLAIVVAMLAMVTASPLVS